MGSYFCVVDIGVEQQHFPVLVLLVAHPRARFLSERNQCILEYYVLSFVHKRCRLFRQIIEPLSVCNNNNNNNLYLYRIKLGQLAQKLLSIKVLLKLKVKEIKLYHLTRSSLKKKVK